MHHAYYVFFITFVRKMKYNTYTFPNGLRLIHLPSTSPIVYCGYQIAAGTRDELTNEEGLAHFCEHCTFKGTTRRTAIDIINELESVGGELNAYTNKEGTVYYAAILKEYTERAVDLLTDIVFHSTYPQQELNKEKEVVCDEIESFNDSPAELIYDEFENLLFEGHPLGHNILGEAQQVRNYTTADVSRFTQRYYQPSNMVFFAYGDIHFQTLVETIGQLLKDNNIKTFSREMFSPHTTPYQPRTIVKHKETHQAHVMVGNRAYAIHDRRRIALYLLNNILGGPGMNARLNLSLREQHGLVYTVESIMVSYADTGMWNIYFGCDPEDIEKCLRLVRNELDLFMKVPLSDEELATAKQQIKGQIALACDNRENFALDFGKSFLHYGWEKNITALYQHIDQITAEDIQEVATDIFPQEKLTVLIYQ